MCSMGDKRQREWMRARKGRGFTLAETLMVVAILTVLMAVAFIGLVRWRKTLRQVEYDNAAREICIAAQNHLALAESQGLLEGVTEESSILKPGTKESEGVYYFAHRTGLPATDANNPNNRQSVLALMLPFGAIDENVRGGGSYLIRYQPTTATVIDAFYTENATLSPADHDQLVSLQGDANKSARRDVQLTGSTQNIIVGYYHNAESGAPAIKLKAPVVHVTNGDKLTVEVVNPDYNADYINQSSDLKLIVEELPFSGTGESVVKEYLTLSTPDNPQPARSAGTVYTVTLDDVTTTGGALSVAMDSKTSSWVAVAGGDTEFTPGCNLKVYAVITSTKTASAPAVQSAEVKTNSLFATAEPNATDEAALDIEIASFRHLANLTEAVSGFTAQGYPVSGGTPIGFEHVTATQTTDLQWDRFKTAANGESTIIYALASSGVSNSGAGTFMPVSLSTHYALTYDGAVIENEGTVDERVAHHKLSEVKIEANGNAGIFARLSGSGSTIKNLEVVNATVTATGGSGATAGALVGALEDGATIQNVLVRTTLRETDATKKVSSTGTAGGLVGTVTKGAVKACASAVYVSAAGAAGGLAGTVTNGSTVEHSYSGGHTAEAANESGIITYAADKPDVTSTGGAAGGLVGSLNRSIVSSCYATCSAKGTTTVGGLAGSSSNSTIKNCYVTGLVAGGDDTTGAFVGSLAGTAAANNNHYYQMVNGPEVLAVGGITEDTDITPFDTMDDDGALTTLNSVFAASDESLAIPYNTQLALRYNGHYAFKTIAEVMKDANGGEAVDLTQDDPKALTTHLTHHYGDWPSLEVLVINR